MVDRKESYSFRGSSSRYLTAMSRFLARFRWHREVRKMKDVKIASVTHGSLPVTPTRSGVHELQLKSFTLSV